MKPGLPITIVRCLARVLSTSFLVLVVVMAIGEGLPPIWKQPTGVRLGFLGLFLMLAGAIAGWKKDALAAILLLAGYAFFPIIALYQHDRIPLLQGRLSPFDFALIAGILFGICGWRNRSHTTSAPDNHTTEPPSITDKDRALAQLCLKCPVCNHARRKQRGIIFWFVKTLEGSVCPNCQAYERVYGRKAHEPLESKQ